MVDLTAPELKCLLWCVHTVALAYSTEAPEGSVLESAEAKLYAELREE